MLWGPQKDCLCCFQVGSQFLGLAFKALHSLASLHFFHLHLPPLLAHAGKEMASICCVKLFLCLGLPSAWSALLHKRLWNLSPPLRGQLPRLEESSPASVSLLSLCIMVSLLFLDRELLEVKGMSESVWSLAQDWTSISQIDVSRIWIKLSL